MLSKIRIRVKIFLSFLLLVGVISLVFAISSYSRIINTMNHAAQKHGVDVIRAFSQLAAPYIFESDYTTISDIAIQLIEDSDIEFITITDAKGKVWLSTKGPIDDYSASDQFYNISPDKKSIDYRNVSRNGKNSIEFIYPISAIGKVSYLVISEISLDNIKETAEKRIQESLFIAFCMIIFSSLIAFYLAKLLTTPIENLVYGTKELALGNLTHRINVTSFDEIGELSTSFNSMTEQLEKESSDRKHAENKLRENRDNLEVMVRERTRELSEANQQLSEEIAERSKATKALKKSEERYKRLSEVTTEGIVLHNSDSIIDCNSTFEKIFDYTCDEIKGNNLLDSIFPAEHQETVRRIFIDDGSSCETLGKRKDGTLFPIHLHSIKVNPGTDDVWVSSIRDITEQRKLETMVHQAQRLDSIGMMAGGVAHDLNNILSGIIGYPDLMLDNLPKDSELRKPLRAIQEAGERASTVVADLLTIARGVACARDPYNLNSLILEYLESPEFKKLEILYPNITFQHQLEAKQPVILCSPVHIKKCFMNLVTNAAEAIIVEGGITISTYNRHFDDDSATHHNLEAGDYVIFKLRDNGPGISDIDLEHIFEPFYSKKILGRSGTGLGLTVVWNTIQDHDGKIFVESNGQGTSFKLYFPISDKLDSVEQSEIGEEENLTGHGEHILVVDDEKILRDIASQMLQARGYQVYSVSSGELAVEFIKEKPVDLLVLDMLMDPGMNGYQTFKEIINISPNQRAIIASGFSESEDVKAAIQLGASGFIKKPYSQNQLGLAVRNALL